VIVAGTGSFWDGKGGGVLRPWLNRVAARRTDDLRRGTTT